MPDIFIDHTPDKSKETPLTIGPAHLSDSAKQSVQNLLHERQHTIGAFAAYTERPKGFTFVNQEPDEIVILFLRRHFITNVPWIFYTFLLLLIPPFIALLTALPNAISFTIPPQIMFVLTTFYYLLILGYAFSKFVSWFYNIGIVTQKRLVDLDSSNILSHNTAAANFNELVDVKFTQNGFFQSFFNYGDIHIQTEAIHANFEFLAAPKPTQVTDIISDLRVAQGGEEK